MAGTPEPNTVPIDRIVGRGCVTYTYREEANVLIGHTLFRFAFAVAALVVAASVAFGQATDKSALRPIVLLAAIEGPIGPATTRHVEKVIAKAAERQAEVLILRLDTPGGLADAMRDIISEILTSPTPVVGYVAPPGAHAASAGTYISAPPPRCRSVAFPARRQPEAKSPVARRMRRRPPTTRRSASVSARSRPTRR
jgi:hypothetical protein